MTTQPKAVEAPERKPFEWQTITRTLRVPPWMQFHSEFRILPGSHMRSVNVCDYCDRVAQRRFCHHCFNVIHAASEEER